MGQVTVSINGRIYRLACGDGEEARVAELAADISDRIDRLVAEVGNAGQDVLLLMVALLLADEASERASAAADGKESASDGGAGEGAAEPSARAKRAAGRG